MLRNKRSFSCAIVTREVRNNDAVIQKKQANLFFFKKLNMLKRLQSNTCRTSQNSLQKLLTGFPSPIYLLPGSKIAYAP